MNNTEETRLVGEHKKWPWWLGLLLGLLVLGIIAALAFDLADNDVEIETTPTVQESDILDNEIDQLDNRLDQVENRQFNQNDETTVIRIEDGEVRGATTQRYKLQ